MATLTIKQSLLLGLSLSSVASGLPGPRIFNRAGAQIRNAETVDIVHESSRDVDVETEGTVQARAVQIVRRSWWIHPSPSKLHLHVSSARLRPRLKDQSREDGLQSAA
jgi:hypothetical protein